MAGHQHVLTLQQVQAAGSQLSMRYSYDKYIFHTSYWYDFDLQSLESVYGAQFMEKVYFHCAAFAILRLCSLKPDVLDWGPYARWHTAEFERVWRIAYKKLSSQWRYENNLPHMKEPQFVSKPTLASSPVVIRHSNEIPSMLIFFGGGKDSLVMFELLRRAGLPFSSLSYSHTLYGRSAVQHQMNITLLDKLSLADNANHHKVSIFEDVLDTPVLATLGKSLGVTSFIEGETPSTLFSAVPILLQYHYTAVGIGHERSANVGNLVWESTGEEVNHQWGKSKEAELLLGSYLREALVSNVHFFSVLQPIHDAVIFSVAETRPDAVVHSHSCNASLLWCKRCPKCCYVWLSFMAYLPCNLVDEMFDGENLLNVAENATHFTEMLGLGTKKPFDCIGEIDEFKMAFELCRRKGIEGRAMEIYREKVLHTLDQAELARLVTKYTTVHVDEQPNLPPEVWQRLQPVLCEAGESAKKKLETALLH